MIETHVNQDACQGKVVNLSFTGAGTREALPGTRRGSLGRGRRDRRDRLAAERARFAGPEEPPDAPEDETGGVLADVVVVAPATVEAEEPVVVPVALEVAGQWSRGCGRRGSGSRLSRSPSPRSLSWAA